MTARYIPLQKLGSLPEHPSYQISFRMLRPDDSVIWLEDTGAGILRHSRPDSEGDRHGG